MKDRHGATLSPTETLIMVDHLSVVFDGAAFSEGLLPSDSAANGCDLMPPTVCPLAAANGGGGLQHQVTVHKVGKRRLRLFTMAGVQLVGRCSASCTCGVRLFVSEYRDPVTRETRYYPDAHSAPTEHRPRPEHPLPTFSPSVASRNDAHPPWALLAPSASRPAHICGPDPPAARRHAAWPASRRGTRPRTRAVLAGRGRWPPPRRPGLGRQARRRRRRRRGLSGVVAPHLFGWAGGRATPPCAAAARTEGGRAVAVKAGSGRGPGLAPRRGRGGERRRRRRSSAARPEVCASS